MDLEHSQIFIDPTVTVLTPGCHGERCLGNGTHPGIEYCCDECDIYLVCFLNWEEFVR